ncbi:unnamed protein product [Caenorhabditis bovis]|uniref:Ground-like domain-containing protein n=1 Tax=Caenorhabditis bovis TaxID=2654633 RepID=A0A8S1EBT6_9PELO|nr:unnamed protein product [Caenorhabditis bovis]
MLPILLFFNLFQFSFAIFFGGCGCRPQCNCAPRPQPICPPAPCGGSYRPVSYTPQYYNAPRYESTYQTIEAHHPAPSYQVPVQIPIQRGYAFPVPSYPQQPQYIVSQQEPIAVPAAKSVHEEAEHQVTSNSGSSKKTTSDSDGDLQSLNEFESSLKSYKSMSKENFRKAFASKLEEIGKCSSLRLREIMREAMSSNVAISKLKISQLAKREFGFNFDVICSHSDFSFLISSNIYCHVEHDDLVCLAYQN